MTGPIFIRGKTPEWIVWRDNDVYYARNMEDGKVFSNISASTLLNIIMEEMPNNNPIRLPDSGNFKLDGLKIGERIDIDKMKSEGWREIGE